MAEKRLPILQGEYKLIQLLETLEDSKIYKSQSVVHAEQLFAVREFKLEGYEAPEKRAIVSAYFQPIALSYMDFVSPHLTSLRNFFIENGHIYFVFDYIPGRRLSKYLRDRHRPFTENEALDIAYNIAMAMEELHSCNPIKFMADVCLGNVILIANGNIALTDFGLGKLLLPMSQEAPRMGTVGYAAPEQYGREGIVSRATDIYGLGVIMHQLVSGIDPMTQEGRMPLISEVNPAISDEYMKIVRTATRTDATKRYYTAADMAGAIYSIMPKRGRSNKSVKGDTWGELLKMIKKPFVG